MIDKICIDETTGSRWCFNKNIRGGVALRVMVCAVSLLAVGVAIFTVLKTFEVTKADDYRRAVSLSEYGLQEAFEKIKESPDWDTDFEDEPFEEGEKFSVAFTREERGGVLYLTIASTGKIGSISRTSTHTMRQHVSEEGDTSWVNEGIR